jgi:hypothetical protein
LGVQVMIVTRAENNICSLAGFMLPKAPVSINTLLTPLNRPTPRKAPLQESSAAARSERPPDGCFTLSCPSFLSGQSLEEIYVEETPVSV